jgi:formamidopyrimidine-DNA glycosylase
MPELPDVEVYTERILALFGGIPLRALQIKNPFLLRSVAVPAASFSGKRLISTQRLGKRVVLGFEGELYAVIHLMIAGRLHLKPAKFKPTKLVLCSWDFGDTQLVLTEAGTKRRASLHLVSPRSALTQFERGGLEPLQIDADAFVARLRLENRTLKRVLTDPRLFSGIGNAYSDEILHHAQLSPVNRSHNLDETELSRLYVSTQQTLREWTQRLRDEVGDGFPEHVTAFRPEMAVHGRFGQPCPVCGAKVQRIVHSTNEVNYCPTCQTHGKLLRDGGLSRLLHADWPKTPEELDERRETLTQASIKATPEPPTPAPATAEPPATTKKKPRPKPRTKASS